MFSPLRSPPVCLLHAARSYDYRPFLAFFAFFVAFFFFAMKMWLASNSHPIQRISWCDTRTAWWSLDGG